MRHIWKEGGALAGIIEGYEHRPQQEEFAAHVEGILDEGGLLLVEAPTGVGKSLAYLIPAIRWAVSAGARVVVSTNTKNLQDQLYSQDIPRIASLLGKKLDAAVLKGRSNYLCVRRWHLLRGGQIELPVSGMSRDGVISLEKWISGSGTGDLGEFAYGGSRELKRLADLVRIEEGMCDPGHCSVEDECFFRKLRRRAWNAQILCVNHAILMGQLLGCWDILPPFDVMIVDESHNIPRVAADRLGVRLGAATLRRATAGLLGVAGSVDGRRLGSGPGGSAADLVAAARRAGECGEILFDGLRSMLSSGRERTSIRYREGGEPSAAVRELGGPLLGACRSVTEGLRGSLSAADDSSETLEEMEAGLALWTHLCEDLEQLLNPVDGEGVFWIDTSPALRWMPFDVADRLGPAIDGACPSAVLTSATLTVGGGFEYYKSLVGLTPERSSYPRCVSVDTPFDLDGSVLFLVPGDAPDPRERAYPGFVARALRKLLECSERKALVLFTSHMMLRHVREILEDDMPGAGILAQGVDGERMEITKSFKKSRSGALLGTASFWEGVDFPGEEAEILLIARLPFPVPSEPVVEARSESLQAMGIDPFWNYHLPEAVMKLRQGFGRLIRTRLDRGVVVILDPRIVRASYSGAFLNSLPVKPKVLEDVNAVAAAAADWFQGVKGDV